MGVPAIQPKKLTLPVEFSFETDKRAAAKTALKEQGLAEGIIRLRTDPEVSIRAVAAAVAAMRPQGETLVEVSPVGSST